MPRAPQLDGRVDDLMLKLRPLSAPNRVALFHSVVAFSNGTHRILGDGMCAAALVIANTSLAVISRSAAYDDMLEKLARSFSLAFTGPNVEAGGSRQIVLPSEQREPGREMAGARLLRERLLRDGKVLDSGILKVSSFINHQARPRSRAPEPEPAAAAPIRCARCARLTRARACPPRPIPLIAPRWTST